MTLTSQDLLGAFLCLKSSVKDTLVSTSEVKIALQLAGFNPSNHELNELLKATATISLNFNDFCVIAQSCSQVSKDDIIGMISEVVVINRGYFKWKQLEETFLDNDFGDSFDLLNVSKKNGMDASIDVNKFANHIIDLRTELLDSYKIYNQPTVMENNIEDRSQLINLENFCKTWRQKSLRGSFFLDKEALISHQYHFVIKKPGDYIIGIKPEIYSYSKRIDLLAFIFEESSDGSRTYYCYTNQKSEDGHFYCNKNLGNGKYVIIPFTSGCLLRKTESSSKNLLKLLENDGKHTLTQEFLHILKDIFHQIDLNGNSLLDRQEFNLYNWRTSGEVVQDDEWNIVLENFDVFNGELTEKGFISLHQMEAEDNDGDTQDLWLSLESMGFNTQGKQHEASPFIVTIFNQNEDPELFVSGLRSGGKVLDKALIRAVMELEEPKQLENNQYIFLYKLMKENYGCFVVENKSSDSISLKADCSKSVNYITSQPNSVWELTIDAKSAIVVHHLVPDDSSLKWDISCNITIII